LYYICLLITRICTFVTRFTFTLHLYIYLYSYILVTLPVTLLLVICGYTTTRFFLFTHLCAPPALRCRSPVTTAFISSFSLPSYRITFPTTAFTLPFICVVTGLPFLRLRTLPCVWMPHVARCHATLRGCTTAHAALHTPRFVACIPHWRLLLRCARLRLLPHAHAHHTTVVVPRGSRIAFLRALTHCTHALHTLHIVVRRDFVTPHTTLPARDARLRIVRFVRTHVADVALPYIRLHLLHWFTFAAYVATPPRLLRIARTDWLRTFCCVHFAYPFYHVAARVTFWLRARIWLRRTVRCHAFAFVLRAHVLHVCICLLPAHALPH